VSAPAVSADLAQACRPGADSGCLPRLQIRTLRGPGAVLPRAQIPLLPLKCLQEPGRIVSTPPAGESQRTANTGRASRCFASEDSDGTDPAGRPSAWLAEPCGRSWRSAPGLRQDCHCGRSPVPNLKQRAALTMVLVGGWPATVGRNAPAIQCTGRRPECIPTEFPWRSGAHDACPSGTLIVGTTDRSQYPSSDEAGSSASSAPGNPALRALARARLTQ
jgi:hypothetical protein